VTVLVEQFGSLTRTESPSGIAYRMTSASCGPGHDVTVTMRPREPYALEAVCLEELPDPPRFRVLDILIECESVFAHVDEEGIEAAVFEPACALRATPCPSNGEIVIRARNVSGAPARLVVELAGKRLRPEPVDELARRRAALAKKRRRPRRPPGTDHDDGAS
jgi:hypothetical protein